MAELKATATVRFELTLTLSEGEARALEAIAGYGDEAFVAVFYQKLGRAYLHPHESALRGLLAAVRAQLTGQLAQVKRARGVLSGVTNGGSGP